MLAAFMHYKATRSIDFLLFVRLLREELRPKGIQTEIIALGLLESMFHVAARKAPDGGIGRLSNQQIADGIGFYGEADWLIATLVRCKWLLPCSDYRLAVANWSLHKQTVVASDPRRPDLARTKWRTIRLEVLKRDKWTCQYCGKQMNQDRNATVDHVVPYALRPNPAVSELLAACRSCNSRKGNR